MRIATWNIERRRRSSTDGAPYEETISDLNADVVVVTEPGSNFIGRHGAQVTAAPDRPGDHGNEAWVTIVGNALEPISGLEIPYERLATAASIEMPDRNVAVYGSVLPWNAAQSQAPDVYGPEARTFVDVFDRALREQVDDVKYLLHQYGRGNVFWMGDFNHPLVGSLRGFSRHASDAIRSALDDLGMTATNQDADHAKPGIHAIDLICGPFDLHYGAVSSFLPTHNGRALSDHRAYVIEVEWP
jgi:endonuclease/exonuclease/phosphatase family metal-dependent hydrolase